MTLIDRLKNHTDQSFIKIPKVKLDLMLQNIDQLKLSQQEELTQKIEKLIPHIELPNVTNKAISINDFLTQGKKVILTFYRGGWCPYSNLELKAFQDILPAIESKNAVLLAISPDTPYNSLCTSEINNLSFQLLTDTDNQLAKQFNLVYKIPKELNDIYLNFGVNLEASQNNANRELPINATYVINTNGKIISSVIKANHKMETSAKYILEELN